MFENAEVPLAELPTVEGLTWRDLDPRYSRILQIQSLILSLVIAAVLVALQWAPLPIGSGWPFALGWSLLLLIAGRGLLWPLISVPRKGYAVRARDVVYKSGVLWQTVTAVPFNRIQHVETSSTPLDRQFALATLQLFTAGGSGGDLKIYGLPAEVAESLRLFILETTGASIEGK